MGPTAPRATFTVSGRVLRVFSPRHPADGFHATDRPLLRFSVLLEAVLPINRTRSAMRVHLSWSSVPLQRSTEAGARMTRRVPAAGTVRPQGFSPSRRLSSPATMTGLFHPAYAPGVEPGPPPLARTFRSRQGGRARVPSPRLSLPPRRARVGVLSSLALRQELPARGAFGDPATGEGERGRPTGAAESRSQRARCFPWELPAGTSLPEVCGRPDHTREHTASTRFLG